MQAQVNDKTATPINATIITAATVGAFALLVDLDVLADMVSIGTLFVFFLVSLACLWKRYQAPHAPVDKVVFIKVGAVVFFSCSLSFCYSYNGPHWISWSSMGLLAASTLALKFHPTTAFTPTKFTIPLQPLIPCLAVFSNIFLISSLAVRAYYGFAGLFAASAIWYVIYGVQNSPEPIPWEVGSVEGNRLDAEGAAQLKDVEVVPSKAVVADV